MPTHVSRRRLLSGAALGVLSSPIGVLTTSGVGSTGVAELSASDLINPYQFGALGNGRADDTAALQAAVAASIALGKVLDLLTGTYKVTGSISGSGDVRIINSGGAKIVAAAGTYASIGVLAFSGSATEVAKLSASPAKGATAITTATATGMVAGDIGAIYNPTVSSFSGFRTYYRAGEFFEVLGVSGTTLNLRNSLYALYASAAVDVYKITPVTGFIRDVIIEASGGPASLIVIDYANGFKISNPTLRQTQNDAIMFTRSVHCLVENPQITNTGAGGDDYGVAWGNCQHCRTIGGEIFARRHAHAVGGADTINAVPSRDIVCIGSTLRNDPAAGVHCADIHGNSEDCGYEGCTIFGGFSPQGMASFLRGCTVYAMNIGTAVYAAELLGGTHRIERNAFHFYADPSEVSRGAIDFGGNNDAITGSTTRDLTIIVRDNILVSSAFGANTMLLYARNAGSTAKINIRFADNDLRVNNFHAAVRLRLDKGIAKSDFVDVECGQTTLANKRQVYPEAGYFEFTLDGKETPRRCRLKIL